MEKFLIGSDPRLSPLFIEEDELTPLLKLRAHAVSATADGA